MGVGIDMVWIAGGAFRMGSDGHRPEEAPAHRVAVEGFWIDRYPVTNRDFERFVRKTRYVTLAERVPDPAGHPAARPELLVPGSVVFVAPTRPVALNDHRGWWTYVPGADWRHPRGPGSSVRHKPDHPVVHVAWEDVQAYARWAGKEIPSEAEWEFAARGGLDGATSAWGEDIRPDGRVLANTWRGEFPVVDTVEDGFEGTSPVMSYPANGYGVHDMTGNVWEWTADEYGRHGAGTPACCGPARSPRRGGPRKVMKGGSHLCAPNHCRWYRPAARMPQAVGTSTSHLGFRCVVRP
ncbi:formylglycine-generating enzyme family protein [Allokutzneria oryzae]|uniref:Formylglycine-generating enzyme family protein n=1 Tax=Allokutzneria oryzae TaxID=1378989 RepID=A0ABV5ZUM0_9PSEU